MSRYSSDDGPFASVITLIVFAAIFAMVWYFRAEEHKEWERHKIEYECVLVETVQGEYVSGHHYDHKGRYGTSTHRTPDREAWRCNDGVLHWRNK